MNIIVRSKANINPIIIPMIYKTINKSDISMTDNSNILICIIKYMTDKIKITGYNIISLLFSLYFFIKYFINVMYDHLIKIYSILSFLKGLWFAPHSVLE